MECSHYCQVFEASNRTWNVTHEQFHIRWCLNSNGWTRSLSSIETCRFHWLGEIVPRVLRPNSLTAEEGKEILSCFRWKPNAFSNIDHVQRRRSETDSRIKYSVSFSPDLMMSNSRRNCFLRHSAVFLELPVIVC